MCLKHRMQEGKSLRKRLGPCYERLGTPLFAVISHVTPQEEASFSSPLSLIPQRSNKDKGTGWRDGNQSGHGRKKEVKLVLPRKAEMR